ncbi:YcxB family protein [Phreatobacter stygius]|uniref:YcxB family protein n=1 Tax=Phreatobacter stygius TaxID=1940610 RepID=A0A4D7B9L1_9HYPH|nr:YcxB family protein [Phreatobacter stygius]QCI67240.1 YcxB family protein [Phreatobacter stygius]
MASTDRAVTVTLTEDDYAAANKLHVLNEYRRPWSLIAIACIVVIYCLFIYASVTGFRSFAIPGLYVHIIFIALLALPAVNYLVLAPYTARKTFRQQKTLHHPITYSWSEAGLKATNVSGEWLVPWTDYLKWSEDDRVVLFYQAPRLFQMLPKRAVTAEQLADVMQCAALSKDVTP